MAGLALLVLLAFVVCVVLLVVVGVAAARSGAPATSSAVVRAARRHETLVSLVAAVTSLTAVIVIMMIPGLVWTSAFEPLPTALGVLTVVSPFVGAVAFCLTRAVGELLWPRPHGAVRTAALARRSVRDLGGRRLLALASTVVLGLGAVLAYGLTATPDGRHVERSVMAGNLGADAVSAPNLPYPGWPFGVPIAVALVGAFAAAVLALQVVRRRPRLELVTLEHDDAVRRTSAARVLAGTQVWVGSATAVMMLVAAAPLDTAGHSGAALTSALAGGVVGVVSLVVAATAVPAHRTPTASEEDRTAQAASA